MSFLFNNNMPHQEVKYCLICKSQFYTLILKNDQTKQSEVPALHFFTFVFISFLFKRIKLSKLFDFKIVFLWPRLFFQKISFLKKFRNVKFDVFGRNRCVWPVVVLFVVVFFPVLFCASIKHLTTRRCHGIWKNTNTLLPFISPITNTFIAFWSFLPQKGKFAAIEIELWSVCRWDGLTMLFGQLRASVRFISNDVLQTCTYPLWIKNHRWY